MSSLDKLKELKVMVGIPSTGNWPEPFAMSLVGMMGFVASRQIGDYRAQGVQIASIVGSMLQNSRLDMLKGALGTKSSHLMFVDSDQTFPRDTLHRLIKADKDVVAANIATKRIPAQPTAKKKGSNPGIGENIYTTPESTGLEQCWRVGTGLILIKRKVLLEIGLNVFCPRWEEKEEKYTGEDWPFMEAIEKAGFDIWIDHDLSKLVGHVGSLIYTHDYVTEEKEETPQLEIVRG